MKKLIFAVAATLVLICGHADLAGQEKETSTESPSSRQAQPSKFESEFFEAPVMLVGANRKPLRNNSAYPSPAFLDIDGDGKDELVVGGLSGNFCYWKQVEGNGLSWGTKNFLSTADGEKISLDNW